MSQDTKFKDFIISICKAVYAQLGSGHSESIYQKALQAELQCQGLVVDTEYPLSVEYCDTKGRKHFLSSERIDIYIHQDSTSLFLDNKYNNIILELKATTKTPGPTETEQVKKYLREFWKKGNQIPYGIVINFPQPNNAGTSDTIHYKIIDY
jgi:GxxExxY protein